MSPRGVCAGVIIAVLVVLHVVAVSATDAQMYFASDPFGKYWVTNISEGSAVWIIVIDNDKNIDCNTRDKIFANVSVIDPNTNARIEWLNIGNDQFPIGDFLKETGADTGVFASSRSFRIGGRGSDGSHTPGDLIGGDSLYVDGIYTEVSEIGRVENMDTLLGEYRDPIDLGDVAVAMAKVWDTGASIFWDSDIYKDAYSSATILVIDSDENLNCAEVEYVPIFILVNPGLWNPVRENSAANFYMLKQFGGVDPNTGNALNKSIQWHNIYDSGLGAPDPFPPPPFAAPMSAIVDDAYYVEYPTSEDDNIVFFDTVDPEGFCRVVFYAQETGASTGVFQLNLNNILTDLGFGSLCARDVLVAYYLDPNDFDDFAVATTYIEELRHSEINFTDAAHVERHVYWIGHDAIHVQVIDASANTDLSSVERVVVNISDLNGEGDSEWIVIDEMGSNSPEFFAGIGAQLRPVWDACGLYVFPGPGGYQLQMDNWRLEAQNEDTICARYNATYYSDTTLSALGDADVHSEFPPEIAGIRSNDDVSFATVKIADTQVFDGSSVNMYFVNQEGLRVPGYTLADSVFIEVIDPDQNEDPSRRERVDAYWDGAQDHAYAMHTLDIHGNQPGAKIFVLNPRNGNWASVDLHETEAGSGAFISATCTDLFDELDPVPSLDAIMDDTILAFYQDPSNHSDVSIISIKIGPGGGGVPPIQASTTRFVNSGGEEVEWYTNADNVYVKVIDASFEGFYGIASILGPVEILGSSFDLYPLEGASADTFMTGPISLLDIGENVYGELTATYSDPTESADVSSDTTWIANLYMRSSYTYTLESVNPIADTFTLRFEGSLYMEPQYPLEDIEWRWHFQDGSVAFGQIVTHTFNGLGEISCVTMEVSVGAAVDSREEDVWGLGGLLSSLNEALESRNLSTLQILQTELSWSGGSLEKIYRACVEASLKVFDIADRYGLTSIKQLMQASAELTEDLPGIEKIQGLWPVGDSLIESWKEAVEPLQAVLERLPGLGALLREFSSKAADIPELREIVGTITLPQIYQEAEDIAAFVDDLLTSLTPVVSDGSFELQVPTCAGCNPDLYISLDHGDIAGVLAGIAVAQATLEGLLAYTPGDLIMTNLGFQLFDDGDMEVQGWDTVESELWDAFYDARGNGILDLDGSGDGDSISGHEVLPESCLTLRDEEWLHLAKEDLLQAVEWLRVAIQEMPLYPGPHELQIEWPVQVNWAWFDEPVVVDKTDLLTVVDTFESSLLGPTQINIDIDSDGVADYSTVLNLAALFDDPITDLKDLLPDLIVTDDPDDPLLVIQAEVVDGIDQNWKIDGVLDWDTEQVFINFSDPTFGDILSGGRADDLLAFLLFGRGNILCQTQQIVLEAASWHMVSLPGQLCDSCTWMNGEICGDLVCALGDDINPLIAYRYSVEMNGYYMVPPAENICYQPGMSVWVRTSEEDVQIDAIVNEINDPVKVPLENGWNQIGNPYLFAVNLNSILMRCGVETKTLNDAQVAGWISGALYAYDTSSGSYLEISLNAGYLPPWTGSWLHALVDNCTLIFSPYPAPPVPPTTALSGRRLSASEVRTLQLPPLPPMAQMSALEIMDSLVINNMPNPVRSEHTTVFKVQGAGAEQVNEIRVDIYTQNGLCVFTQRISAKELAWHTANNAGELLANGIYLYQVWVCIGDIWYPMEIQKLAVVR